MKFTYLFSIAAAVVPALSAATTTTTLAWDAVYDKGSNSLNIVACSNGPNGLITQGYTTFKSLPGWSHVGGASAVAGWNDPDCGSCWNVTYVNSKKVSKSLFIQAIDVAPYGYNVGKNTMNELTGGQAESLGRVTVTSARVADSHCGA